MEQPATSKSDLAKGISRRSFLKYCGAVAAALGLGPSYAARIADALTSPDRPPVLWLHFAECTGCSEAFLRSTQPSVEQILFDTISLDYHETVMVASGVQAEANRDEIVAKYSGQFICIVEGAIPTAQNGIYGTIGGRTMLDIAKTVIPKAKSVIAFGTCSSFGGLASAAPNPTGAKGVQDALGIKTINLGGCPPSPITLVSTLASYLLYDKVPPLDGKGRPLFAYGKRVHDQCGKPYGCIEDLGCKGKKTYGSCPTIKFNDATSWDVQAGHHCIGCTEPAFWDQFAPLYSKEFTTEFFEEYAFIGKGKAVPRS